MQIIYNISVYLVGFALRCIALFNKKIAVFIKGRTVVFKKLKEEINENDKVIWMHCASLGEFEQGRPLLEKLRHTYPSKKIVLTFFSPSGYEVRKDYDKADLITYLPMDTLTNAKRFINIVNPEIAIFVKYEFWPNYLKLLAKKQIPTLLISGIFRENQIFFKFYGGWMRKALTTFKHFFVQNEYSKKLLETIGLHNVTIAGDTRFDRVFEITQQNNELPFIKEFVGKNKVLVAGSTWEDDEALLIEYINNAGPELKFIIAPHNIDKEAISEFKGAVNKNTVLYSEKEGKSLGEYQVFIVDTIGILTKIYSYATIAYVGGGYTKTGVHNVLEPATFGVPIIIGPNYSKFREAVELVEKEACFSVDDYEKLSVNLGRFFNNDEERQKIGIRAQKYVVSQTGSTLKILKYIENEIKIR